MDLVKHTRLLALAFVSSSLFAQGLSITVGNAVAGQTPMMKSALFVFRVNGCADLSKLQVSASNEAMPGGTRRSTQLQPVSLPNQPGVYGIQYPGDAGGTLLIAITANCQNEAAGALVPIAGRGFVRESTQLLTHAPSQAEIETALKSVAH